MKAWSTISTRCAGSTTARRPRYRANPRASLGCSRRVRMSPIASPATVAAGCPASAVGLAIVPGGRGLVVPPDVILRRRADGIILERGQRGTKERIDRWSCCAARRAPDIVVTYQSCSGCRRRPAAPAQSRQAQVDRVLDLRIAGLRRRTEFMQHRICETGGIVLPVDRTNAVVEHREIAPTGLRRGSLTARHPLGARCLRQLQRASRIALGTEPWAAAVNRRAARSGSSLFQLLPRRWASVASWVTTPERGRDWLREWRESAAGSSTDGPAGAVP